VLTDLRRLAPRHLGAFLALSVACMGGDDRETSADSAARRIGAGRANAERAFRAQLNRPWELAKFGARELPPTPARPANLPVGDPHPGARPTIRFSADPPGAGGRSFCNGYGGPYVLRGDSLRILRLESSAVGCDGPDSLETRFFRALLETRRFELDSSSLVLIAADGMRLAFVPGPQPTAATP
jgi:heat shock protein HslJ